MGLLGNLKSELIKKEILKALAKLDFDLYIDPIRNTCDSIGLDEADKQEVINNLVSKGRVFLYNLSKNDKHRKPA